MHRIDADGFEVVGGKNQFTDGDPSPPFQEATVVGADWMNAVQEEIAGVVEANTALVKADNTQLLTALNALFGRLAAVNTWTQTQNFNGAGAVNVNAIGGLFVANNVLISGGIDVSSSSLMQALTALTLQLSSTLRVAGLTRLAGGVESATAATNSTPQTALTLTNGYLALAGVNPNSNVGFSNKLTPMHVPKAWGVFTSNGSGGVTVNDGVNIASAVISGDDIVVTFGVAFASATYAVSGSVDQTSDTVFANARLAGSATIRAANPIGGTLPLSTQVQIVSAFFFGRQ